MPSEWAEGDWRSQEGAADSAAAALPADVAASTRHFVAAMSMPETDFEEQLLESVRRWAARHEPPAPPSRNPSLAGSSMSNSRSATQAWVTANEPGSGSSGAAPASGPSSSGRSSEEGSSAAWRLCTWLQRQGWPAQHCASFRSGSSGGGGSGAGWRFTSGHEFVLVHPQRGAGPRSSAAAPAAPSAALPSLDGMSASREGPSSSSGSSSSGDSDAMYAGVVDMACEAGPAYVVDPEFSTQFALASPSARYQVVTSLLPRVFVGSYDRLQQLVEWVCSEMECSFQGAGGMPPWRSLDHVLSKWRLHGSSSFQAAEQQLGPAPLSPMQPQQQEQQDVWGAQLAGQQQQQGGGGAAAPLGSPDSGAAPAFSLEQQQAMRSLLLHPGSSWQTAPPTPAQAFTSASSSCSSMDVAPDAGAGASTPPRSLLTHELTQLALCAPRRLQDQGPAAGILSLGYGTSSTRGA